MKRIWMIATVMALAAAVAPAQKAEPRVADVDEVLVIAQQAADDAGDLIARLELLPMLAEMQEPPAPPEPPAVIAMAGRGSYLGVGVVDIDSPERAKALKLPEERGVEVTRVSEGSPAEKAGLKEQDVILEFNGERVDSVEKLVRLVRETPIGRSVKLLISRNGQTQTLTAVIGDRRTLNREWESRMRRDLDRMREELGRQRFSVVVPDMPQPFVAWRTGILGVEAESLTPQLAEFFGVKKGVLVRSVTKDSAADKAGIKAGDVITKVDGEEISGPSDISAKLRRIEGSKTIPITVVRNRSEVALQVTIEGRDRNPAAREFGPRRIKAPPAPAPPAPPRPARTVATPFRAQSL